MHHAPRAVHVPRADRLIDLPMGVGGVAQIPIDGAFGRGAATLVVQRRDHFDERRDDGIARRGGDAAVEIDVVHEEDLPFGERREEARHLVGERGQVIGGRAFGGQTGRADLENPPRFVDIVHGELVQRGEEAERL